MNAEFLFEFEPCDLLLLFVRRLISDPGPEVVDQGRQVGFAERLHESLLPVMLDPAIHAGLKEGGQRAMLDLPVEHWRVFGGLANCCWSVLEEGRTGWRLVEHNAGSLPQVVLGDDR